MKALLEQRDTRYVDVNWAGAQGGEPIYGITQRFTPFGMARRLDCWWMVAPSSQGEYFLGAGAWPTDAGIGNVAAKDWTWLEEPQTTMTLIQPGSQGAIVHIATASGIVPFGYSNSVSMVIEQLGHEVTARIQERLSEAVLVLQRTMRRRAIAPATTLKGAIEQIQRLEVFSPPSELLELARRAVAERPTRASEDIEEWAQRLSQEAQEPLD